MVATIIPLKSPNICGGRGLRRLVKAVGNLATTLKRAFVADYEKYQPSGAIDIFIGVKCSA
ncbi:MAG: hypothetical protein IPP67_04150 [Rhodospirillaceae bacterium]|nr:hypothetical protein [Rhodospirillaceae bacterium]